MHHQYEPRTALMAGATGLVGSALLSLLLESSRYAEVHALVRRPLGHTHPKLHGHQVDFNQLDKYASFPQVTDVFCCLGTTIKTAGSQAAFRAVDFDYVVNTARRALAGGASRFLVVSAMGASANSRVFYSRVKGEMEEAVSALGFESVVIVRPSFLAGERTESRPGERIALALLKPLAPLVPKKYRAIDAAAVARALFHHALYAEPGTRIVESDALQAFK